MKRAVSLFVVCAAIFLGVAASAGFAFASGGLFDAQSFSATRETAFRVREMESALARAARTLAGALTLCAVAAGCVHAGADAQRSRAALGAVRALGGKSGALSARLSLGIIKPALLAACLGLLCAYFVIGPRVAAVFGARARFTFAGVLIAPLACACVYASACVVYRFTLRVPPVELLDESRCQSAGIGGANARGFSALTVLRCAFFQYRRTLLSILCALVAFMMCVLGAHTAVSAARAGDLHHSTVELYDEIRETDAAADGAHTLPVYAGDIYALAELKPLEASVLPRREVMARLLCTDVSEGFLRLVTANTGEDIAVPAYGALITRRMAEILELSPGDNMYAEDKDGNVTALVVRQIIEGYVGNMVVISTRYYAEAFGAEAAPNALLARFGEVISRAPDEPGFNAALKLMPFIGCALLALGACTACALYVTLHTRLREKQADIRMLRASGYTAGEVGRLFFYDCLAVTVTGCVLGALASAGIYGFVARSLEAQSVQLMRFMDARAYIAGAVLALVLVAASMALSARAAARVPVTRQYD